MFRLSDLILILFVFASMTAGILFPRAAGLFHPFLIYLLMSHLFLSLLRIQADTIWQSARQNYKTILLLSFVKLMALPTLVYFLFLAVYPPLCRCSAPPYGRFHRRGGPLHLQSAEGQQHPGPSHGYNDLTPGPFHLASPGETPPVPSHGDLSLRHDADSLPGRVHPYHRRRDAQTPLAEASLSDYR